MAPRRVAPGGRRMRYRVTMHGVAIIAMTCTGACDRRPPFAARGYDAMSRSTHRRPRPSSSPMNRLPRRRRQGRRTTRPCCRVVRTGRVCSRWTDPPWPHRAAGRGRVRESRRRFALVAPAFRSREGRSLTGGLRSRRRRRPAPSIVDALVAAGQGGRRWGGVSRTTVAWRRVDMAWPGAPPWGLWSMPTAATHSRRLPRVWLDHAAIASRRLVGVARRAAALLEGQCARAGHGLGELDWDIAVVAGSPAARHRHSSTGWKGCRRATGNAAFRTGKVSTRPGATTDTGPQPSSAFPRLDSQGHGICFVLVGGRTARWRLRSERPAGPRGGAQPGPDVRAFS